MVLTIRIRSPVVDRELCVRCDLADPMDQVEVLYHPLSGWLPTEFTTGDTRHTDGGLADVGSQILANSLCMHVDRLHTEHECVLTLRQF